MVFTLTLVVLASAISFMTSITSASSSRLPTSNFPVMPRQTNSSNVRGISLPLGTKKFYAENFCNQEQKLVEHGAWADALEYAQALASWRVNSSYQAAMDMYMGNDSRGPLGDILEANIIGAAKVHTNFTWPEKQRLFIFCEEPSGFLSSKISPTPCEDGAFAYESTDFGEFFDNHYVVFCPLFYAAPTLTEALRTVGDGVFDHDEHIVDSYLYNRGHIYFHESLHLADLTTPLTHPIGDSSSDYGRLSIYGPQEVVQEAKDLNTAGCLHTADAYSCAAAAILAQQKFHLVDPPVPAKNISKTTLLPRTSVNGPVERWVPLEWRPFLPDPNTKDNHVKYDIFQFEAAT